MKNRLKLSATALVAAWLLGLGWWAGNARSDSSAAPAIADEQVGELIASLNDSRSAIRREALVRLARLGRSASDAIPGVTNRLQDEDPFVRAHAARAACRIGVAPDLVIPVLADLLQPEEPQLCCLASLVLGEIGTRSRQALPALRTCMKSRDSSVRLHAAEAILKIDSTNWSALRELLAGMEDDSADLRYFAVNALSEAALDNEQAIEALQRALTDADMNVSITAAVNLSKRLHVPRAEAVSVPESEELARLVDNLRDPSSVVRQMAAIRLGMSGPAARRASIALRDRLADPDLAVRVHAAHALWQIEQPAGAIVPVLVDLLSISESNIRVAATFVLGEIGPAAVEALPPLYDMFAGSKPRDRLLLAMAISLIEPRDREMVGILIGGLSEQAGDARYQSAMALGSAPVAHQRRVEKALSQAADDRNLRVQAAAAEALSRFELRVYQARNALSTQYVARVDPLDAEQSGSQVDRRRAGDEIAAAADEPDEREQGESQPGELQLGRTEQGGQPQDELAMNTDQNDFGRAQVRSRHYDSIPAIGDIAQSIERKPVPDWYDDPDEGLRPIREVNVSIRLPTGEEPPDYAAARMAGEPGVFHPLGMTRGWSSISYGWDAPANYYKPVYFEDVNLERYGIHYGLCSPFISFGKFFACFPFLPYKLLVQPPCECHYTLGLERPNNCVPVHCFGWGRPKTSLLWWFSCHNYCPIRATCPWTLDERNCLTTCPTDDELRG